MRLATSPPTNKHQANMRCSQKDVIILESEKGSRIKAEGGQQVLLLPANSKPNLQLQFELI